METKFCTNCGAKIPADSQFCDKCGAEQNGNAQQNVTINNYNSGSNGSKQVIGSSNPVNFIESFKLFWTNFANFGGVSSRSEYWFWMLWQTVIGVAMGFIFGVLNQMFYASEDSSGITSFTGILIILYVLWGIACIIPTLSLTARRLRDMGTGTTGIILLIVGECVPFVNFFVGIAVFIMTLMPSVKQ